MKDFIRTIATGVVCALITGCASPYLTNRGRDAADIFTATLGAGIGASARVGPLSAGLSESTDWVGLRGGRWATYDMKAEDSMDVKILFFGFEWLALDELEARGKTFSASTGVLARGPAEEKKNWYIPFLSIPYETKQKPPVVQRPQLTQIEVQAACLLGLRLGFNPGELVDFLLGWTTLDIYGDDIGLLPATPDSPTTAKNTSRTLKELTE